MHFVHNSKLFKTLWTPLRVFCERENATMMHMKANKRKRKKIVYIGKRRPQPANGDDDNNTVHSHRRLLGELQLKLKMSFWYFQTNASFRTIVCARAYFTQFDRCVSGNTFPCVCAYNIEKILQPAKEKERDNYATTLALNSIAPIYNQGYNTNRIQVYSFECDIWIEFCG